MSSKPHEMLGEDLPGVLGTQVDLYRNLTTGAWSVRRVSDRVVLGHCDEIKLADCFFNTNDQGKDSFRPTVRGTVIPGGGKPQGGGDRPGGGLPQGDGFWVGYGAATAAYFCLYLPNGVLDAGAPVRRSSYVTLSNNRLYAEAISAVPNTLYPRPGYDRGAMLEYWTLVHDLYVDDWAAWYRLYD